MKLTPNNNEIEFKPQNQNAGNHYPKNDENQSNRIPETKTDKHNQSSRAEQDADVIKIV